MTRYQFSLGALMTLVTGACLAAGLLLWTLPRLLEMSVPWLLVVFGASSITVSGLVLTFVVLRMAKKR